MFFDQDGDEPIPVDGVAATTGSDMLVIDKVIVAGNWRCGGLKRLTLPDAILESRPSKGSTLPRQVTVSVDLVRGLDETSSANKKTCHSSSD